MRSTKQSCAIRLRWFLESPGDNQGVAVANVPHIATFSLALLLLLLLLPHTATARWQKFGRSDGLAGDVALRVLEDRSGNIWVTTSIGVSRFDGLTWRNYTSADGVPAAHTNAIFEDSGGNLWVGGLGEVSRFDGVTWKRYTQADGMGPGNVSSIAEDREGNLWFGMYFAGVVRFDGNTWQTYTSSNGLPGDDVRSIAVDRSGGVWLALYFGGVVRFDGTTWETVTGDGELGINANMVAVDSAGDVWVGAWEGHISRYDGTHWEHWAPYGIEDQIYAHDIWWMLEDRAGNYWFATGNAGAWRFDGAAWQAITAYDGLTGNDVFGMAQDRRGGLWFATSKGLSRYDGDSWRIHTSSLAGSEPRLEYADRSGNLWVATTSGVDRYNGAAWRHYTTADGLASNEVTAILEDRTGSMWFGTKDAGLSRLDSLTWRTYTTADGLAGNWVFGITEDRRGALWFVTGGGASRYDGSAWRIFTTADGLASNSVISIYEDRMGKLWFITTGGLSRFYAGTWRTIPYPDGLDPRPEVLEDRSGALWFYTGSFGQGVYRYDGSTWRNFTTADGLAADRVHGMLEDSAGTLWFLHDTTSDAVSSYDGTSWRTYSPADGLGQGGVTSIVEDDSGVLWFGTFYGGITRFDGDTWRTYGTADGLEDNIVFRLLKDHWGDIWVIRWGLTRYAPDVIPPWTIFQTAPDRITASRNLSAAFASAFPDAKAVEFSVRFNAGAWSAWTPVGSWSADDLPDGTYTLEARARDWVHNVDPFPALVTFEVDATPPAPVLESPTFGAALRKVVTIRGAATDARFRSYVLEYRSAGATTWSGAPVLATSLVPVVGGPLATWDTSTLPDGLYDLRLSVADSLGLVGATQVTVLVDNHFPFADQTAPATVSATAGGDLYTNDAELHLYFPPHAFADDALVSISSLGAAADTLASTTIQATPAYLLSWSAPLAKPATLTFSTQGSLSGPLSVYHSSDGTDWSRLGGTAEPGKLSLAISSPGTYALFTDAGPTPEGAPTLSKISFTPRVFSPAGGFAQDHLAIGFTLGRSSPVTVRVYNRAGRLVREVVSGQRMPPGASLVRWDGKDRAGVPVTDGLYLVSVQAQGLTERKTIAVVR